MERRIMVVDDEPGIRFTVKAILQPIGFDVLPVESGERCLVELKMVSGA